MMTSWYRAAILGGMSTATAMLQEVGGGKQQQWRRL